MIPSADVQQVNIEARLEIYIDIFRDGQKVATYPVPLARELHAQLGSALAAYDASVKDAVGDGGALGGSPPPTEP